MSAPEETAQPDQLRPDPLASVITQVSANAPVPVRRAPPPRKRPQKAKTPKPVPAPPDPVSLPLTPAANAPEKVTPDSTTLDSPTIPPPSPFQAKPKPKTSPWHSLLSALGCFSSKHFDDAPEMQEKPNRGGLRRKLSSKRVGNQGKQKEATPPLPNDAPATSSKSALLVEDPTATASAPPEPGPSAPANDRGTLGTQEATANSLRAGVILSKEETGDVLSGAVVPPGADGHTPQGTPRKRRSKASTRGGLADETESLSQEESSDQDLSEEEDDEDFLDDQDEEDRIIAAGGMGIPLGPDGKPQPLLTEIAEVDQDRKCLVLDLDETLVHSSFKMIHPADYVVPVEIENQSHNVYVIKRPGVDEFLRRMGELYEVVVFTASLSKYADPVLDQLDIHRVVRHRLFRESCYNHKGNYVKDLSQLGRPIGQTIIIDNSPASYIFHPRNALPVSSWFNDPHDTELTDMVGVLTDLATVEDVRSVLTSYLE